MDIDTACVAIAADIATHGHAIRPGFVAREELAPLRDHLMAWWEEGELRRAGIGRGESWQLREDIRGDYVRWIDFSTPGPFSEFLAGYYEPLRLACNRELLLGLYEYEGHVTVYPPGRFYRRHVDQFRGAQHRKLSVILYLNDDWAKDDGGELRMYLPDGEGERVLDVLPEAGTLVAFLSHEIPHEVLPAKRERLSLTGWFRTRDGLLP